VPDALESAGAASVSERGDPLVQADVSVRGSSFQQVLVTLDGVALADPQTAHHNMDLPFPVDALESVTVIPGPGSAFFGPAALAGTIDLAPRVPAEDGALVRVSAGDFGTVRVSARADAVRGRAATTLSSAGASSRGFMEGTDYEVFSLWGSTVVSAGGGRVRVSAGRSDKDFGAADFYGDYPSRERTASTLVDAAPEFRAGDWTLKLLVRYRGHDDSFTLIEDDPGFYHNEHATRAFIERITATGPATRWGATAAGVERSDALLESSNLGNRRSATTSAFAQHRLGEDEPWTVDAGLRVDDHNRWGPEASPSLGASFRPSGGVRLRGSVARGIRPPSFTELYYSDPKNIGDPGLKPETGWGTEAGADLAFGGGAAAGLTLFRREDRDVIDWVRATPSDPWKARNIGRVAAQGAELAASFAAGPLRLKADCRATDLRHDAGALESKYVLNAPRSDAGLAAELVSRRGFSASAQARHRDIPGLNSYWLLGGRIARKLGRATVFALGRNLLDERYVEIPGVPTAGRSVEAGVEVQW
jgi:iron complex outermembrane receptor protein